MLKIILVPAALTLALATGCSFSVGDKTVDKSKVEQAISDKLGPQLGGAPKSVSCPGNLKGKAGTTMQCTMVTADGASRKVEVTVTSISGSTVNFGLKTV
ncbi:MAG: hypothetical protein QOE54_5548 [Streptosporangiaceae bacterium]|jgi:hypothetical protein|nr:hypothetical protein [Streptosporangiaceae bacterium]MDX6433182.1 hypothetical protein [Streptosporangiaceae bacterium]